MIAVVGRDVGTVGIASGILCALQCTAMLLPIIPTERALKQEYGE